MPQQEMLYPGFLIVFHLPLPLPKYGSGHCNWQMETIRAEYVFKDIHFKKAVSRGICQNPPSQAENTPCKEAVSTAMPVITFCEVGTQADAQHHVLF